MSTPAQSEIGILIDIRAKLAELEKSNAGIRELAAGSRDAHEAASGLGGLFKQGLGIGSGMEMTRRAIDLVRTTFVQMIGASSGMAAEIERSHGRLKLSGEAYQTLAISAKEVETDFAEVTSGLAQYRAQLGQILLDPGKPTVLRAIALDAQALANLPLEQQLEQIAVALGGITNENVRTRYTQELFGRGAAAMIPLLDRLRTEGYDKLRASAKETATVLSADMAGALNKANNEADAAQKRLGVALAPINLRLIEARTQIVNVLAKNAGPIASGVEASFAAAFGSAIVSALEKGAASVEKAGGIKAAFSKLGTLMAGPFGVALITAVGGVIIKELERRSLESLERGDRFAEEAYRRPQAVDKAIPKLQSYDEVDALYNRAVNGLKAAQAARLAAVRGAGLILEDEEKTRIAALDDEIQRWNALIPLIQKRGGEAVRANAAAKADLGTLEKAQTDLLQLELTREVDQADSRRTAKQQRDDEITYLSRKGELLQRILLLTEKQPLQPGHEEERRREILRLQAEQLKASEGLKDNTLGFGNPSALDRTRDRFSEFTKGATDNPRGRRLSVGEAPEAAAMEWSMSLGTQGEQVAGALQSTIGSAVTSISDGIYGWITGVGSFGDAMRNLAATALRTVLDTIIQMGVQWAISGILGKTAITGVAAVGMAARKAETADVVANEGVKAVPLMANAAASSISSWGLAAAIGVAALIAAMAAFGGFADGGYTGDGGKFQPAGLVHRGEVVWSQENIRAMGGVDKVEALRTGGAEALADLAIPAATPAAVAVAPRPVMDAAGGAASGGLAGNSTKYMIAFAENLTDIRRIKRQAGWEEAVVETVQRRLGDIMG